MGITVWRLREQLQSAPECFSYQLNNAAGEPLGLLLADIVDENVVSRSEQENLAQNIVKALTSHFTLATPQNNDAYAFAIVLGNYAKKIIEQREKKIDHIIFYDALAHIIQQAERKKELWSAIKPLRDLFAP